MSWGLYMCERDRTGPWEQPSFVHRGLCFSGKRISLVYRESSFVCIPSDVQHLASHNSVNFLVASRPAQPIASCLWRFPGIAELTFVSSRSARYKVPVPRTSALGRFYHGAVVQDYASHNSRFLTCSAWLRRLGAVELPLLLLWPLAL